MHSQVALGSITHHRYAPRLHHFKYRLSMLYLELDEASDAFRCHPLWSWNRRNLACILRDDHLRHPAKDLHEAVRSVICDFSGIRPTGPISLLTQPRYWGYCINPISVYFVWSEDRSRLEWLLLEVNNTPWDEQHPYVLQIDAEVGQPISLDFAKHLHVSPFMEMDLNYRLRFLLSEKQTLSFCLENWKQQDRIFSAALNLTFAPLSRRNLSQLLFTYPFMSLKVAAAIYWQALKLKLKGTPYIARPGKHKPHTSGVISHER